MSVGYSRQTQGRIWAQPRRRNSVTENGKHLAFSFPQESHAREVVMPISKLAAPKTQHLLVEQRSKGA